MTFRFRRLRHARCSTYPIARLILTAAVVAIVTATAFGQGSARPDKGIRSSGSYAVSDIENINMTNGNLNLSIPLASLPPIAGGKLAWTIGASYNSKTWDTFSVQEQDTSEIPPIRFLTSHLQLSAFSPWMIGGKYRRPSRIGRRPGRDVSFRTSATAAICDQCSSRNAAIVVVVCSI